MLGRINRMNYRLEIRASYLGLKKVSEKKEKKQPVRIN